jgi:outer membrane receptor protein involved in Fe transport
VIVELRVDGSGEHYEPGVTVGAAPPPAATRAVVGAALDAEWRVSAPVSLAASGRLDDASDLSPESGSKPPSEGELRPTGHVGAEAVLGNVTLAAHAGATARPPSFIELYGDRGAFVGAPNLLPESAWTVDAGARARGRVGPLRLAAELVGFVTWARDLITFVPVGAYGRSEATNIGRARLLGVEADLRAVAGPIELRGSYTGLSTEDDSACEAIVGLCQHPPLPGRPVSDLVADLIGTVGPASVRVGVDAVTGIVADVAGSIGVPPRILASAGARVDIVRGLRIALDVRNLLDVRTGTYEGALGPVHEPLGDYYEYPLPGRTILVSVRYSAAAEAR